MTLPALNFNVFTEKEKLATNGSNFTNWALNLRTSSMPLKRDM
jgi:hypothetical protein